MFHRGYLIFNHSFNHQEIEKLKKAKYVQIYNNFTLKIIGGSHFLTLREVIMLLYPDIIKINPHQIENIFSEKGIILILNDYDAYLKNPKNKHIDIKIPSKLIFSIDQLTFLKSIISTWTDTEITHIGPWPEGISSLQELIEFINYKNEQETKSYLKKR